MYRADVRERAPAVAPDTIRIHQAGMRKDVDGADQIIVVDDDPSVREAMRDYLARHGYRVRTAAGGAALDRLLEEWDAGLVILDLMMPGEDGLAICRRLAGRGRAVLMVSALGEVTDRVVGLELGADDYLAKPFDPRELLARVRALLRRNAPPSADGAEAVRIGAWRYDAANRRLRDAAGAEVALTAGEHLLLRAFAERPGRLLSRAQLLDLTRGEDAEPFDRAIDLAVSRLRRRLGKDGAALIETVRGAGYRLRAG